MAKNSFHKNGNVQKVGVGTIVVESQLTKISITFKYQYHIHVHIDSQSIIAKHIKLTV